MGTARLGFTPRRKLARARAALTTSALIATALLASCREQTSRDSHAAKRAEPHASILLFVGKGTSPGDVDALKEILDQSALPYSTADADALNAMDATTLGEYTLLIVPGGNFIDMGKSLSRQTTTAVRNAVRSGMNYLGICAGGFLAGHYADYNSFSLIGERRFAFYSAEFQGIRKTSVLVSIAGGATLDQYWEDGPQLSGWGSVVAKYPDGTPAVVQGSLGAGSIILTGIHPEAPDVWRRGLTFTTPASVDHEYAATLIRAALKGDTLAHF